MATSSQVKAGLDEVATIISDQRAVMQKTQSNAQGASDILAVLPTEYADVIATINAYGTANAFEALAKAELAKLSAEFTSLKADADAVVAIDLND